MPPKKEVSELQALVTELIAKVDNLTKIVNSKQIVDLNESIVNLGKKFDTLAKSAKDNHDTVMHDIASIRDGRLNKLIETNKEMSIRMSKMDEKIINLERQTNLNSQRARENNLEIHGITDDIDDDSLEGTVINMLKLGNIKIVANDIQGIHRLPRRKGNVNKPVIAKFVNRKTPEMVMHNRRKFSTVRYVDIGLPSESKIYFNLNLSPPFKELDYFCRKLKKEGKIISTFTSHANVKLTLPDNSFKKITHMADLKDIFPGLFD